MRVSIVQINPTVGDLDGNMEKMLEAAEFAKEDDVDLVVFPEHALTGAPLGGLGASLAFHRDVRKHLEDLAAQTSLPMLLSCVQLIDDGDFAMTASELFVLDNGVANSLGIPALADEDESFGIDFGCDGISIVCGDHYPVAPAETGDTILLEMCSDAFASEYAAPAARGNLGRLAKVAEDSGCYVAYVNLCGSSDSVVFGGGSCVVTPDGQLLGAASPCKQEIISFDTKPLKEPEYQDPSKLLKSDEELMWESLVVATRDYVAKSGFSDVVIGLSGGIDSAVVAAVAADALGGSHVHGVLMPSPYSSEGSVTDSQQLAENLGISTVTLPINQPMEAFHGVLAEPCGGEVKGLAAENLQARIRTIYLMTLSNAHGWMVLNTGNKSEAAMGFSTLYGDTAGAYAPVGELYKTQVYALASWRAQQGPSIPEACITKAPSAELYPGAKDADRLPPYEELDKVLTAHIEDEMGADELVAAGFPRDLVEQALKAVRRNEYKRRNEPIGPQLEGTSLTADRAWPITNGWNNAL